MSEIVFIEQQIIDAVRKLLAGKVNEKLNNWNFFFPLIEFSGYRGASAIVPVISLSSCEQAEKERIIRQDVYTLAISFSIPETADSELSCYAYANAFCIVLGEDVTLGGVADRAVITNKKYVPPKKPNCGMEWELIITLRITVENLHPCRFST
jgi:hypothetical protein